MSWSCGQGVGWQSLDCQFKLHCRDVIKPLKVLPLFFSQNEIQGAYSVGAGHKYEEQKIQTILKSFASNLSHDSPQGQNMIGYSPGTAGIYLALYGVLAIA